MATKGIPSVGTQALSIITELRDPVNNAHRNRLCDELTALLIDSDFREWRLDPSKRPARKGKPSPIKQDATKKKTARRRVK